MAMPKRPAQVALMDSVGLVPGAVESYLAPEELEEYSALRRPRRTEQWLAGRTAAKFVFLERDRSSPSADGEVRFRQITAPALAAFPPETYRGVIVASDKSPAGGAATIGWRESERRVRAAISHTDRFTCALIGNTELYSVDIEVPARRVPAFYLQNFTERERNWAGQWERSLAFNSDWLYTLLWSAKECLLKTPCFRTLSLWNMSSLEISVRTGMERLKSIQESMAFSGKLEALEVETSTGLGSPRGFRLAVGGTANLILAALLTGLRSEKKGVL